MTQVAPSILAANYSDKEEFARQLEEVKDADLLHVDVMDGVFVENTTLWNDASTIKDIPSTLPKACHLMVHNPDQRVEEYMLPGVEMISFHIEAAKKPEELIAQIQGAGIKAGLAINPETEVSALFPYLDRADYVLLMSVHPGASGKAFQAIAIEKVLEIRSQFPEIIIVVDGGETLETAPILIEAGAQIIVAGSSIFGTENPKQALEELKKL